MFPLASPDEQSLNPWATLRNSVCLSQTPQRKDISLYCDTLLLRFLEVCHVSLCVVSVCVHVNGYTYGFECIYAHANGGQRLILGDFSTFLLVLFFTCSDSASQWTWSSSLCLGWLANEFQPSACLHGSSMPPTPTRITEMYHHTQCLHRWGYKLQSSCLLYRHFADWAISLTHGDFNFLLQQCSGALI